MMLYMITLQCLAAHFGKLMTLHDGFHSMGFSAMEGTILP